MLISYLHKSTQAQISRGRSLGLAALFQKPLLRASCWWNNFGHSWFQTRVILPLVLFLAFSDHFLTLDLFLKVTSAVKLFFAIKWPYIVTSLLMIFYASFSRYLNFCVFVKSTNSKFCDVIKLLRNGSYIYAYFFWILCTIKMRFSQILVCYLTKISNVILAQCWRLKTSYRPFYHFIKTTI